MLKRASVPSRWTLREAAPSIVRVVSGCLSGHSLTSSLIFFSATSSAFTVLLTVSANSAPSASNAAASPSASSLRAFQLSIESLIVISPDLCGTGSTSFCDHRTSR